MGRAYRGDPCLFSGFCYHILAVWTAFFLFARFVVREARMSFGPIVYRLGHQVFQPEADHPLGGIPVKDMFYVYILKSTVKDVYYIGSTGDLRKRLAEHNQGKTQSIRHLVPLELKYYEAYGTRTLARKREIELKRNSFKKKEVLERIEL